MLRVLIALVVVMTLSQTASAQLLRRRAASDCADGSCSVPAAKEAPKKVEVKAAPTATQSCTATVHRVRIVERARQPRISRRCN